MAECCLCASHKPRMKATRSTCADRLRLGVRSNSSASIRRPDARGVVGIEIVGPKILWRSTGIVDEIRWIERRISVVVQDAERFHRSRQAPIHAPAKVQCQRSRNCVVPSHLAAVSFLPHEPRDVVGNRSIAVVGERWRIDCVIRIFTECGGRTNRLSSVGHFVHALHGELIRKEARVVDITRIRRTRGSFPVLRNRSRRSIDLVTDNIRNTTERVCHGV